MYGVVKYSISSVRLIYHVRGTRHASCANFDSRCREAAAQPERKSKPGIGASSKAADSTPHSKVGVRRVVARATIF